MIHSFVQLFALFRNPLILCTMHNINHLTPFSQPNEKLSNLVMGSYNPGHHAFRAGKTTNEPDAHHHITSRIISTFESGENYFSTTPRLAR